MLRPSHSTSPGQTLLHHLYYILDHDHDILVHDASILDQDDVIKARLCLIMNILMLTIKLSLCLIPPCLKHSSSWACSTQHCRQRGKEQSHSVWRKSRHGHWFQRGRLLVDHKILLHPSEGFLLLGPKSSWLHSCIVLSPIFP